MKKQFLVYGIITALFIVMFVIALRNYNAELALGKVAADRIVSTSMLGLSVLFYFISSIGVVLICRQKNNLKKLGIAAVVLGIVAAVAEWLLFEPFTSILSLLVFTGSLLLILMLALKLNR